MFEILQLFHAYWLHSNIRIWHYLGSLRPVAWLQNAIFGDFLALFAMRDRQISIFKDEYWNRKYLRKTRQMSTGNPGMSASDRKLKKVTLISNKRGQPNIQPWVFFKLTCRHYHDITHIQSKSSEFSTFFAALNVQVFLDHERRISWIWQCSPHYFLSAELARRTAFTDVPQSRTERKQITHSVAGALENASRKGKILHQHCLF